MINALERKVKKWGKANQRQIEIIRPADVSYPDFLIIRKEIMGCFFVECKETEKDYFDVKAYKKRQKEQFDKIKELAYNNVNVLFLIHFKKQDFYYLVNAGKVVEFERVLPITQCSFNNVNKALTEEVTCLEQRNSIQSSQK